MARKSLSVKEVISAETQEYVDEAEVRGDIALSVLEAQTLATQQVVEKIAYVLEADNRGLPNDSVMQASAHVACEIVKNLAQMDIQVADYQFPPGICALCSAVI